MGRRKKKSGAVHFFGQDRGLSNSSIPIPLSLVAPQFHPIARRTGLRSRGYMSTCRRSWRGCPPVFSRHVVLRGSPVVRSGREWYEVHHRERERVPRLPPLCALYLSPSSLYGSMSAVIRSGLDGRQSRERPSSLSLCLSLFSLSRVSCPI